MKKMAIPHNPCHERLINDSDFLQPLPEGVFQYTQGGQFYVIMRKGIILTFLMLPLPAGEGWGGGSNS